MSEPDLHERLIAPFTSADLEWKVQSCGNKNGRFWALVVPYLSARAIQSRLDEAVGPGGWRNRYEPIMKGGEVAGFLCYLALRIDGEWVEKCDGAELTDIEAIKGGISNSLKRCAVQWGLGRYLYSIDTCWADIHPDGKERAKTKDNEWFNWDPPKDVGLAPESKPENHQGNGQRPQGHVAPAANGSTATRPDTPPSANTPATTTRAAEPTPGDLRAAKARADEATDLVKQGLAAKAAAGDDNSETHKTRSEASFKALGQIDRPLASALWKATARGTQRQRAETFAAIAEACALALKAWDVDPGHEHIEYMKNEAGWPWPADGAMPDQVAKLVELARMTLTSGAKLAGAR